MQSVLSYEGGGEGEDMEDVSNVGKGGEYVFFSFPLTIGMHIARQGEGN